MNWLNKLERKIGRYAVPNLIIWLIGAYTIGYVFGTVSPGILSYLTLCRHKHPCHQSPDLSM